MNWALWAADPAINQRYNQDYKCRMYKNTEHARLYNAGGELPKPQILTAHLNQTAFFKATKTSIER